MKLPGRGWLEFDVRPGEDGGSTVRQAAVFDARGVWGRCYWHALCPIHVDIPNGAPARNGTCAQARVGRELARPRISPWIHEKYNMG